MELDPWAPREVPEAMDLASIDDAEADRAAVVTTRLRLKGIRGGPGFDRTPWFRDTCVRTGEGWKYAFAQASLPLPDKI